MSSRQILVFCFDCGQKLSFAERVGFRAECDRCGADVHVCKNCRFYDPKVYNECRETSADVVKEKDRANYCEFFEAADQTRSGTGLDRSAQSKEDLRAQAEALFKKK